MVGYVMISRDEYLRKLEDPIEIHEIIVYVLDGGQQTRGIQKAITLDSEVAKYRDEPEHFPMLRVYAGQEMKHEDFATVK